MENYTLFWRVPNGEMISRGFNRVTEMRTFARAVIQNGGIAMHYTVNKTWDGRIWRRPISDLRGYGYN